MTTRVKTFQIKGNFRGKRGMQPFQYQLRGLKKEEVIEHVYSVIGSQHRVQRRNITIQQVKEI